MYIYVCGLVVKVDSRLLMVYRSNIMIYMDNNSFKLGNKMKIVNRFARFDRIPTRVQIRTVEL